VTIVLTIVLAAGKGERLGGPKALLAWPSPDRTAPDRPLAIAHAEARLAAESVRVLIVTRGVYMRSLLAYVRPGIDILTSQASDELGPAGSLAVAASRTGDAQAILVTPVDTPPARAETTARLLERLTAGPASLVAVRPRYGGRTGHPVALRPEVLERYRSPNPPPLRDHLRELGAACVDEDVADPAVLIDLDTPAEVMRVLRAPPRFL
jgi:CTP:molybdopterin cytidylyltransferase MocA